MVVEQVDQPFFVIETRGTTIRYQGETPHIVAMSGEVEPTRLNYCGVNDLFLFTKNGGAWTRDLVVRDSGETPADSCMAPSASTYGWVVGMYPALAISPTGQFAVAWRDIHSAATLQRDDLARSDLEASIGGPGNWPKEMIDCGTAAGDYTTLAWEPSGGLVGSWYTDIRAGAGEQAREGTWVGRRAQPAWEEYRLSQGKSGPRTSMAVAPDGTIGVTWYEDQMLKYAFVAPGRPLSEAVVEIASHISDNSGMYSSLAYTADSIPIVAHYRCNRYLPDNPGCDTVEDGPVWSWREDGVWDTDDIEPSNDEYSCGDNTQIAVRPDGSIVAVYSCQVYEDDTQPFNSTLRLAWRSGL